MKHLMIDLETMGVKPGCAVLSVGAVQFNPREGVLGEQYYGVAQSDQSAYGLKHEPRTVEWWSRAHPDAKRVFIDPTALPLKDALALFAVWYKTHFREEDICVWGNGADFDVPILRAAYDAVDLPIPWPPFSSRCYRTIKNLRPDITIERHGHEHNALADATAQAVHLMDIVRNSTLTLA